MKVVLIITMFVLDPATSSTTETFNNLNLCKQAIEKHVSAYEKMEVPHSAWENGFRFEQKWSSDRTFVTLRSIVGERRKYNDLFITMSCS